MQSFQRVELRRVMYHSVELAFSAIGLSHDLREMRKNSIKMEVALAVSDFSL